MNSPTPPPEERESSELHPQGGLSLHQVFSLTNLTILVVGVAFSLLLLGILLKTKQEETELRLANQAEVARGQVDQIFQDASDTVVELANAFPLITKLPLKEFERWADHYIDSVLTTKPVAYDVYLAFTQEMAKKLYQQPEMIYWALKNPALVDDPKFNDRSTFARRKDITTGYTRNKNEIWYHGAIQSQDVHFTSLWYDRTYTDQVMISVTKASRELATGRLLGVAGIDLTSGSISRTLRKFRHGKTGGMLLLNQDGIPLAPLLSHDVPMIGYKYDPKHESGPDFPLLVQGAPLFSREPGLKEIQGRDGKSYFYQTRKLIGQPYSIISYQEKSEAYASLYRTVGIMTALASIFLGISIFFRHKLATLVIGSIQTILWNIEANGLLFSQSEANAHFEKLEPRGPQEIARISHHLNMLYARLETAFEEAQNAKERAELATKVKSRFLSVMSHEIRTPLNSMLGLTDVLLLSPLNPEQVRHLRILQRSGQSLLRILNDILDFSRLEVGKLAIEPHEFDLFELLYDVESLMRFDAEAKGLQFRVTAPTSNFRLLGDAIRIRQALLNLVGNAIKFTSEGIIEIRVTAIQSGEPGPQTFQFEIADSGIGIPPDAQSKLFSEFSQADASVTRRYGGTGLGLVISKQIVELLGGHLTFQSESGKGSTFQFTVPLEIIQQTKSRYLELSGDRGLRANHRHLPTAIGKSLKPDTRVRVPEEHSERPEKFPSELQDTSVILAVDDDEDNHRLLDAYMKFQKGVRIEHVYSGADAIAKMKTQKYALVLMDMQMPEMDGIDATQEIRRLQRSGELPPCPVVMLSANAFMEDQEKSIAAGADEHVGKPIKLERFNELLQHWLS